VLASALENANYGDVGGRLTYGNESGRQLLQERHNVTEMIKRLEAKVDGHQHQITGLQNQNAVLQQKITDLMLASEGYRKIRNRFINVYCRDVLGRVTRQEYQQINDGNNAAHGGDAVTDASLYTSGERRDYDVLMELYGLSASQISHQGKCFIS